MGFKTTLVLLLVLLGLGAFVYFFALNAPTSEESTRQSKLLLSEFEPEKVRRVTITHPREATATAIVLARPGGPEKAGKWRLERPVAAEADQGEVDGLLTTLEHLERKATVDSGTEQSLGLAPARLRADFEMGERTVTVLFGDDDASAKSVFAAVEGRKDFAVVPSYAEGRFDRRASDFREKSLFTLDRWAVTEVELSGPGAPAPIVLKKDGDEWVLGGEDGVYADKIKVEDLVSGVHGLRAKDFVPTGTAEAESIARSVKAAVTLATGSSRGSASGSESGARQTLQVFDAAPPDRADAYVRLEGRDEIVTIDRKALEQIVLDPEAWRSQALLHLGRDQVSALEVRRPGAPAPLARLERKDGAWRYVAPVSATADAAATDELVDSLKDLKIVAWTAKKIEDPSNFGLDDRTALVVALETPKSKQAFRLGKTSLRPDGYFVEREGKPAALEVVLPKAAVLRGLDGVLRDRNLLSRPAAEVARLDVARGGKPARPYVHGPEGWSTPDAKADGPGLDALAADLAGLRAERILPAPEDLHATGLQDPWLSATVAWKDQSEPAVIDLGKVTAEAGAFNARFRRGKDVIYFTLRKDVVDSLDKEYVVKPGTATGVEAPTPTAKPEEPLK
jgi:hypothetical protein